MADIGTLEQWYYDVPIVTRVWTTATVLAAVLVQCGAVTPYRLFFNPQLVWDKREVCLLLLRLPPHTR